MQSARLMFAGCGPVKAQVLRKATCMATSERRCRSASMTIAIVIIALLPSAIAAENLALHNQDLTIEVTAEDSTYEIRAAHVDHPVVRSIVAAKIDGQWLKSVDYPKHKISKTRFSDELGNGQQITVASSGLTDRPDLLYTLRIYDSHRFADIQVEVRNRTGKPVQVHSIRSVEAVGNPLLDLGGHESSNRVLSDSFSENRPAMKIYDLDQVPGGIHLGVGSQLVYNQDSRESIFFGALTSNRFLTIMHLQVEKEASSGQKIVSYTIESTGTTEIQDPSIFPNTPEGDDRVYLVLPLAPGKKMASERLMISLGTDYHAQLEAYGTSIRQLHHARVGSENMMGWWSWTAYYRQINENMMVANAEWLARHLKESGYNHFHIDSGYERAPGDYQTADPTRFPHGMVQLSQRIHGLGLTLGIWTAPFYVGDNSWVYAHHKEWLVHNSQGGPIRIMHRYRAQEEHDIYVLDTTHPGAQKYLRQTYRTLVKDWGISYIKLDFMDNTAIEGYYYRPHTTALEAQRIGLEVIRKTVGDRVLLDKDGSPMLNPVGLVDEGRISQDTAHTLHDTKESATGIAARYYMHRNFFMSDPDAFNISRQMVGHRIQAPLTLNEAQVSIVLAAVSGGMFEIGDDLATLGSDPERLALATNPNLLQIAKLGRAATPVDLLTYRPEDEQPSVFFLRADNRQAFLAVFNWTEGTRTHEFNLADLGLFTSHPFELYDALNNNEPWVLDGKTIHLDQPAHSVKLLKIVDDSVQATSSSKEK